MPIRLDINREVPICVISHRQAQHFKKYNHASGMVKNLHINKYEKYFYKFADKIGPFLLNHSKLNKVAMFFLEKIAFKLHNIK